MNDSLRGRSVGQFGLAAAIIFALNAPASAGNERSGERLAHETCLLCHGTGVGPDLDQQEVPFETLRFMVRNGLNAMPAFRQSELSDADVKAISDYLAQRRAANTTKVQP